jgi:acetoin utilization deacetylase AcuC-like enzyme
MILSFLYRGKIGTPDGIATGVPETTSLSASSMHLVHHPGYDLRLGDHVFPSSKFQLIRDRLVETGLASEEEILRPDPATRAEMILAHEPEWIDALSRGTLTLSQVVRLEIPYSQQIVRAFFLMCGGSILAARQALQHGWAYNVGGGFHHAFPGHGEGFCAINDVAVALRVLLQEGRIRRAMVVDLDVHQGNGTAAIFADSPEVFTVSFHQLNNYPHEKPPSSIDVNLPDGTGDEAYLAWLHSVLTIAIPAFRPDLIAYVAGSDPFREDKLGGLSLTHDGMRHRDRIVFETAKGCGVPVFVTLAGGYARNLEDTISLHANTARVARSVWAA